MRVIAATNSDLKRMVEDGTFREDLFYRLNVIPVRVPPLRERRADIPLLAQHFLDRLVKEAVPPRGRVTLSQDAQQALMAFDWPGNVRQLENVIERTLALSPGRTQIDGGQICRRRSSPRSRCRRSTRSRSPPMACSSTTS